MFSPDQRVNLYTAYFPDELRLAMTSKAINPMSATHTATGIVPISPDSIESWVSDVGFCAAPDRVATKNSKQVPHTTSDFI